MCWSIAVVLVYEILTLVPFCKDAHGSGIRAEDAAGGALNLSVVADEVVSELPQELFAGFTYVAPGAARS